MRQRKVAAGCRVCEGTLFTPKIKENRFCHQNARKKIACGMQCGYSFLRGRRCAATRSPTPHGSTYAPPPTLRTVPNKPQGIRHLEDGQVGGCGLRRASVTGHGDARHRRGRRGFRRQIRHLIVGNFLPAVGAPVGSPRGVYRLAFGFAPHIRTAVKPYGI